MSESAAASAKRKKPPTFQHLPEYKAKTLKKAWVQKTKIKSKWAAEKRKEGIDASSKLEIPVYEDEDRDERDNSPKQDQRTSDADSSEEEQGAPPSTAKSRRPQASVMHPSRAHIHPDLPVKPRPETDANDFKPAKKQKTSKDDAPEPISLRELTRQAYSKETLHNYKSDPLKKHCTRGDRGSRGGALGRGRGHGRGDGRSTTGRGQPNMKLRMNAMLAKIKQDFGS
ncbi:hypothetical protein BDN70DRAFT_881268 [Pholiota conissans]|uniref:rRNA-processing protein FYV7 n=1 Tax=Pholiota conissans TaxID=109636 RepID=A0A9P6CSJ1_9AGAR|nr:hypothetical protein BDN70DRAFT_881268 [Pholiota conissans]